MKVYVYSCKLEGEIKEGLLELSEDFQRVKLYNYKGKPEILIMSKQAFEKSAEALHLTTFAGDTILNQDFFDFLK